MQVDASSLESPGSDASQETSVALLRQGLFDVTENGWNQHHVAVVCLDQRAMRLDPVLG